MNKKAIYHFSENTFSLLCLKGIDLVLTIWLIPFLIFKIGIENYGQYVFALAVLLFLVNVINYGFNLTTVRELARNRNNRAKINQLFNEVLSVKVLIFAIAVITLFFLVMLIPKFFEQKELFVYGVLILVAELFSLHWFFLGIERMRFITFIKLASTIIFVVLVLFFVENEANYKVLTLLEGGGLLVTNLLAYVLVLKRFKLKVQFIGVKNVIGYMRLYWSSFVNLLLPSTTGQLIIFLVGLFGVPIQVSIIQIGVKVSAMFSTFNAILTKVFYPIVNRDKKMLKPSKVVLILVGLLLSVIMLLSAKFLAVYWLKLESDTIVKNTIVVLKILSGIPFLMSVISAYGVNGLLIHYKDKLYQKITVMSTFIMVVLAIVLIPNYFFYGGAFALLGGRFSYALMSYISFKKMKTI